MDIKANKKGKKLKLALSGRLDTSAAPQLEEMVRNRLDGIQELQLDMEHLEYVSSAGLRVLLTAAKKMKEANGSMALTRVTAEVMEIFRITGFDRLLEIQ